MHGRLKNLRNFVFYTKWWLNPIPAGVLENQDTLEANDHAITNMQKKNCKISNNLMNTQEKLKMTGCMQKVCKTFFPKLVQYVFLSHRLSKKLKIIKI